MPMSNQVFPPFVVEKMLPVLELITRSLPLTEFVTTLVIV